MTSQTTVFPAETRVRKGLTNEPELDNRVPGGDKGPEGLDQRTGIRQPWEAEAKGHYHEATRRTRRG